MTDLVEMLRHGLKEHEMLAMGHVLFEHAADEIEKLRTEVARLNKTLKWEQYRSERVGTHGPDCWNWGHQHYECAIRHFSGTTADKKADFQIPEGRTMLKPDEASRLLGISRSTFRRWVEKGSAPKPLYISERCPRWRVTDIQALKEGMWK